MKFKEAVSKSVEHLSSPQFIERVKSEDETMLKHIGILKKINALGYITNNSQAGRGHKGISALEEDKGKIYEHSERAYIMGFMLESMAVEFIKEMALTTDKLAMSLPMCGDDVRIRAALDIPLTAVKMDGQTNITSHTWTAMPQSVWEQQRKELHIDKTEKIAFITCMDMKWNRNASGPSGLFTDVLKVLHKLK